MRYFSVLEQEIWRGILGSSDPESDCLLFTRSMNNVNADHKHATDFVDITADDEIEPLAQRQLLDLVDQKLLEKLPPQNIFQYENLEWANADDGGICETEHAQYLKDLAMDFEAAVKRLIDANMTKRRADVTREQVRVESDDVYRECVQHMRMVSGLSEMFWGRREEMHLIRDYIDDRLSGAPLVLYGHAGCGKTAILAKTAQMVNIKTSLLFTLPMLQVLIQLIDLFPSDVSRLVDLDRSHVASRALPRPHSPLH